MLGGRPGKFDKTIVVGRRDGNKMKLLCWVEELWWFAEFEYMLDESAVVGGRAGI